MGRRNKKDKNTRRSGQLAHRPTSADNPSIFLLPIEVITVIIRLAVWPHSSFARPPVDALAIMDMASAVSLSLVCKSFRDILLSDSVWHFQSSAQFIWPYHLHDRNERSLTKYTSLLSRQTDTMPRLHLSLGSDLDWNDITKTRRATFLAMLSPRASSLSVSGEAHVSKTDTSVYPCFSLAALTHLKAFTATTVRLVRSWDHASGDPHIPHLSEALEALQESTELEYLCLNDISTMLGPGAGNVDGYNFQGLKILKMGGIWRNEVSSYLRRLSCPRLHTFHLFNMRLSYTLDETFSFRSEAISTVKAFSWSVGWEDSRVSHASFINCLLWSMPLLESMEVVGVDLVNTDLSAFLHSPTLNGQIPAPPLTTLLFESCKVSAEALVKLVRARRFYPDRTGGLCNLSLSCCEIKFPEGWRLLSLVERVRTSVLKLDIVDKDRTIHERQSKARIKLPSFRTGTARFFEGDMDAVSLLAGTL